MTYQEIIKKLKLEPHVKEGGYMGVTYSSDQKVDVMVDGQQVNRILSGAIYYLLETEGISLIHRSKGDMIYHFYAGAPVEMLLIYPENHHTPYEILNFHNDVIEGGFPMKVIPGGTWIGSRVIPNGDYSLMGVTMAPGYDAADYELGDRKQLIAQYPHLKEMITNLTK